MGLISLVANIAGTVRDSVNSEFADQYLEFFTCDSLGDKTLVRKGAASNAVEIMIELMKEREKRC